MAAGARLNPRVRGLDSVLELTKSAVEDASIPADYEYRKQETALFASEGASGGPKWAPLSPKYLAWKERQRAAGRAKNRAYIAKYRSGQSKVLKQVLLTSTKILVLTGAMRDAFASESGAGHIRQTFRLNRWTIRLGAQGDAYFKYNAEGGPKLPRRDPQQRTPEQAQALRAAVHRGLVPHLMRALRAKIGFADLARNPGTP